MLNAFEGKQPDLIATREPYESFPHLNERIDRAVAVEARIDEDADRPIVVFSVATGPRGEAIELRMEPSRLLYGIDREAYVEVLKTAELAVAEDEEGEEPEAEASAGEADEAPAPGIGPAEGPVTELVAERAGSRRCEVASRRSCRPRASIRPSPARMACYSSIPYSRRPSRT